MDFSLTRDHREQIKESEKLDKFTDFAWEFKNVVEQDGDGNTNHRALGTEPKNVKKKLRELKI